MSPILHFKRQKHTEQNTSGPITIPNFLSYNKSARQFCYNIGGYIFLVAHIMLYPTPFLGWEPAPTEAGSFNEPEIIILIEHFRLHDWWN